MQPWGGGGGDLRAGGGTLSPLDLPQNDISAASKSSHRRAGSRGSLYEVQRDGATSEFAEAVLLHHS